MRGDVAWDAPLDAVTSLRIGGPADALVTPADVTDVCRLVRQAHAAGVPLMVLGGTNLLVRDGGVRGVVVSLSGLSAMRRDGEAGVFAEGGVRMPALMGFAARHGLSGLEWAAGIPGTVGGAVAMNAGTRLGDMRGCLDVVHMVTLEGRVVTRAAADMVFAYRHAGLPDGAVVVGARLVAVSTHTDSPGERHSATREGMDAASTSTAESKRRETAGGRHRHVTDATDAPDRAHGESLTPGLPHKTYLQYRKDTQPLSQPNAGSVFKNPPGTTAGRVIEDAGFAGYRVGNAQVSPLHANFLVNLGGARAADMVEIIETIQRDVLRRTGISLELEWKVVGDAVDSRRAS